MEAVLLGGLGPEIMVRKVPRRLRHRHHCQHRHRKEHDLGHPKRCHPWSPIVLARSHRRRRPGVLVPRPCRSPVGVPLALTQPSHYRGQAQHRGQLQKCDQRCWLVVRQNECRPCEHYEPRRWNHRLCAGSDASLSCECTLAGGDAPPWSRATKGHSHGRRDGLSVIEHTDRSAATVRVRGSAQSANAKTAGRRYLRLTPDAPATCCKQIKECGEAPP